VTTANGIKILANADGQKLLKTMENRTFDSSSRAHIDAAAIKVKFFIILFHLICMPGQCNNKKCSDSSRFLIQVPGGIPIVAASATSSPVTGRTERVERASSAITVSGIVRL